MKRKSALWVIAIIAVLVLAGCSGKKETTSVSSTNTTTPPPSENTNNVTAAFQKFGVNVEQIKPNIATPDDVVNQRNSNASTSVYTMRAYYREKSNATISNDVAVAYKERMFNYIKSISADNKCYRLRLSLSEAPVEVAAFADLRNETGAYDDWSYKFNGMWLNAVTLYYSLGDEIGIDLVGMGTY